MPMLTTISQLPSKAPKWATTSLNRSEPSESDKAAGHAQGQASPAFEENWRAYFVYLWTQQIMKGALTNWNTNADIVAWNLWSGIYHPDMGSYCIAGNNDYNWYSYDGYTWTQGLQIAVGATASWRFAGYDSARVIIGNDTTDDLEYSTDGGIAAAWTTVLSATLGGSGNLYAIGTKYPSSDLALVCRGSGGSCTVRRATTDVTGSWVAASTQPPSVPTGAFAMDMFWVGSGQTWMLLVQKYGTPSDSDCKLYKSLDDGDTWAEVTGMNQFPSGSDGAMCLAYNQDTGRLVVGGSIDTSTSEEYIGYSDDLGDTWGAATIDKGGKALSARIDRIYYCGGNAWVAIPDAYDEDAGQTVYVSTDDAQTWKICDMLGGTNTDNLVELICNENKMLAIGDNGCSLSSFAL